MPRVTSTLFGVAILGWACATRPSLDDEVLGVFTLQAARVEGSCTLDAGWSAVIDFDATLSRSADASAAWLTLGSVSRAASWDGQVFTSTATAARVFAECGRCRTRVLETLELALLSASQAAAAGGVCPANPLDGGVPAPSADGRVVGPTTAEGGVDAVLACGALRTELQLEDGGALVADDGTACSRTCVWCTHLYQVAGARR